MIKNTNAIFVRVIHGKYRQTQSLNGPYDNNRNRLIDPFDYKTQYGFVVIIALK